MQCIGILLYFSLPFSIVEMSQSAEIQHTVTHLYIENHSEMQNVCFKVGKCCTRTLQDLKAYLSTFKIEDITSKIDDFVTLYRPPVSENIQNETGTSLNDRKCPDLKRNMNSKSSLGYIMFTPLRQLLKRTRRPS